MIPGGDISELKDGLINSSTIVGVQWPELVVPIESFDIPVRKKYYIVHTLSASYQLSSLTPYRFDSPMFNDDSVPILWSWSIADQGLLQRTSSIAQPCPTDLSHPLEFSSNDSSRAVSPQAEQTESSCLFKCLGTTKQESYQRSLQKARGQDDCK